MTNDQAKDILKLYRPGTADAVDPAFTEALELCERDVELKNWFANHCALYAALRAKFKQIVVPEGLKEQIIAERRVRTTPMWQRAVLVAGAVAALALIFFQVNKSIRPAEPHDFATYRDYMGGFAVRNRNYQMDTNTDDLNQIRLFLAQKKSIADYVLPLNLQKNAKAAGCVATSWQGKDVSMICFQSGRPLAVNAQSDLWLFVSDRSIATDPPAASSPKIEQANGLITASWTEGNRTYLLAAEGDAPFLNKFLPEKTTL